MNTLPDHNRHDTQDGALRSKIAWRSSIDGPIATGAFAVITTDDLSTGAHTITAAVTDCRYW